MATPIQMQPVHSLIEQEAINYIGRRQDLERDLYQARQSGDRYRAEFLTRVRQVLNQMGPDHPAVIAHEATELTRLHAQLRAEVSPGAPVAPGTRAFDRMMARARDGFAVAREYENTRHDRRRESQASMLRDKNLFDRQQLLIHLQMSGHRPAIAH